MLLDCKGERAASKSEAKRGRAILTFAFGAFASGWPRTPSSQNRGKACVCAASAGRSAARRSRQPVRGHPLHPGV